MKNNKICKHLNKDLDQEYVVRFTGNNNEIDLICEKCAKRVSANMQIELAPIDEKRFAGLFEYNWLECKVPVIGEMNLPASNPKLRFESESLTVNDFLKEKYLALEPHPIEPMQWMVVTASGKILLVDVETQETQFIYQLEAGWIDLDESIHLTISRDGRYLAVANCYRTHGEVVDIQSSIQTMKLERSDYHVQHCYFPLVFIQYYDKALLVHATDWNHLDISDPATGEKMVRHQQEYDSDQCEEFNGAASFRGELLVSPDQHWIADNAWEWHPVGLISTWNIDNWIEENPWEFVSSESMLNHTGKDYFWGQPMCWINNKTLCIWGWNQDDCQILPAASLFDVETGECLGWFPGPDGSLVFDEHLFAYTKNNGISVWDIKEGNCVLQDTIVNALHYHPTGKYFIDITKEGRWLKRRLSGL